MKTFLISAESRIDITNLSARAAAAIVAGKLGKTSLTELLSGKRAESKGWSISHEEEKQAPIEHVISPNVQDTIKRANKLGVNSVGKKGIRQRNPMKINCLPTAAFQSARYMATKDYRKFLDVIAMRPGAEYGEIGQTLQWSRDAVASYAARARRLGVITMERHSGAIYGRKEY